MSIIIREFIFYCFNSIFSIWFILPLFIFLLIKLIKRNRIRLITFKYFFLLIIPVSIFVSTLLNLYIDLFKAPANPLSIAIAGAYNIKGDDLLIADQGSLFINDLLISKTFEIAHSHPSFQSNLSLYIQKIPSFLPPLLGINGLNNYIQRRANKYFLTALYIIKNANTQQSQLLIIENSNSLTSSFGNIANMLTYILNLKDINTIQAIDIVSKYYIMVTSQSIIDRSIKSNNYKLINSIFNRNEDIYGDINNILSGLFPILPPIIDKTQMFWKANTEMSRARVLILTADYYSATRHLLNLLTIWPYYPYENYEDYKINTSKKFIVEFCRSPSDQYGLFSELKEEDHIDYDYIAKETEKTIKYYEVRTPDEKVEEILFKHPTSDVVSLIENYFINALNKNIDNPIYWLYKANIWRFLPKGKEKFNDIFVQQIEECLEAMQRVIEIDPNFQAIYLRLSIWNIMKAITAYEKEKITRTEYIKLAIKYWKQGKEIFSRYNIIK